MTATLSHTEVQEQAREAYRASLAEGTPLTRDEVGELFGRSPSWGRDRIAEVRRELETIPFEDGRADGPPSDVPAEEEDHVLERVGSGGQGYALLRTPGGDTVSDRSPAVEPAGQGVTPELPLEDDRSSTPVVGQSPTTGSEHHLVMSTTDGKQSASTAARVVAWVGFAFGSVVSVAANWLAAWLPASDMPDGWSPTIATQVGAAVWPVALLLSVEVLSRTAWHSGWHWKVVRLGGSAVVALGSAVISYGHVRAVLLSWGYDILGASVGPLVIDGLMVLSGFALLSMSRPRFPSDRT